MPDRFDAFTERARTVLRLAQEEAQRFNHNYIGTEHLLLGLLREQQGVAAGVLAELGIDLSAARAAVEFVIGRGDRTVAGDIGLTPRAKRVIEYAVREAKDLAHDSVDTEHLLLALTWEGGGIAACILDARGVDLVTVQDRVLASIRPAPAEPLVRRLSRYTQRGRTVLRLAQEESQGLGQAQVGTEHLLLGLIREADGVAGRVLLGMGLTPERVREAARQVTGQEHPSEGRGELTLEAGRALGAAEAAARERHDRFVGTEHLLLGLLQEPAGRAGALLRARGHDLLRVGERVDQALAQPASRAPQASSPPRAGGERFDKFTERARRALQAAEEESARLGHSAIGAEHLLLGLLRDPRSVATRVLEGLGVDADEVRRGLEHLLPRGGPPEAAQRGLGPTAKQAIELAVQEARELHYDFLGTEHLLLGVLREGANPAAEVLAARGVTLAQVRAAVVHVESEAAHRRPVGHTPPGQPSDLPRAPGTAPAHARKAEELEALHADLRAFLADPIHRPPEAEAGLFARLSHEALGVLALAQRETQRFNHNYIGTEHLLLGLVRDQATVAGRVLLSLGVELNKVRNAVEFIIGRGDRSVAGDIGLTPRAKKVIELAVGEAEQLGDQAVGSEHLLLGLVREGEGIGAGILEELGIGPDQVRSAVVAGLAAPGAVPLPAPLRAEHLTPRARGALEQALLAARWYFHPEVDTEHLLLGLLREPGGVAAAALRTLGVELARVQEQFEARARERSSEAGAPIGYSLAGLAAIERAGWEARQRGHRLAGTGHLLLGLLSVPEGHAAPLLEELGIGSETVRSVIEPLLARDEA